MLGGEHVCRAAYPWHPQLQWLMLGQFGLLALSKTIEGGSALVIPLADERSGTNLDNLHVQPERLGVPEDFSDERRIQAES